MDRNEEMVTSESTGGQKARKLARFDLIPAEPLWHVAEHYGIGAAKYEDRNWERGYEWSLSYGAMMRHAVLFWYGEDLDPETKTHHLAAVVFHALALMEFDKTHPELDDRPKAETPASHVVEADGKVVREYEDEPEDNRIAWGSTYLWDNKMIKYVGPEINQPDDVHPDLYPEWFEELE